MFKSRGSEEKDFAVKVLLKPQMSASQIAQIKQEIGVLSMLDHTNIIKYVESFEDDRYMYIVTEYVQESRELSDILI